MLSNQKRPYSVSIITTLLLMIVFYTGSANSVAQASSSANVIDTSSPSVVEPSTIQSDDFTLCGLDSGLWTVVDPMGDGAVLVSSNRLELAVPAGVRHDIWAGNNALRIMQAANDTDFEVEVKFESAVQGSYALQGMLVEQDSDNFLRFDFYGDGVNTNLFAARFTNGSPSAVYNSTIINSITEPLYMRVSRTGDQWIQSYSEDGQSWTQGASFAHSLSVGSVGVFAGNTGSRPAHTAVVDYFFNTAAPITPEDGTNPQFSLTVNPSDNGAVTADPVQASYNCGEVVTLTATPDAGWDFSGWSGDLTGNDNPVTITMDGNKNVTAAFVEQPPAPTYALTTNVTGNGAIAVDPLKSVYDQGEVVTLTANPDAGWDFSGWSGDLTGNDNPVTITMDGNKNVTAAFVEQPPAPTYALTTNVTGNGAIAVDPLKSVYDQGEVVTLTANPDAGWTFDGWSGDLTGTDNPTSITMDADKNLTALFTQVPVVEPSIVQSDDFASCNLNNGLWTLIDPVGDGTVLLSSNRLELAVPAGVRHDIWSGNDSLRIMQAANNTDFEVEVKFESVVQDAYALQGILIEQDNDNFLRFDFYGDGANTNLFAARFTNGSPSPVYNSTIINGITEPLYMRISRTGDQWTQSYSQDGQNWTQGADFAHGLNVGSVGVFAGNTGSRPAHTAVVDYFFNTAAPITPEDGTSPQFALTVNPPTNGAVAIDPDQTSYNCGDVVTLTATPDADWAFDGWSGDFTSNDNPAAITMNGDKTVAANFVEQPPAPTYVLTTNVTGSGSLALDPIKPVYDEGDVVTLTAAPDAGWTFDSWSGDLTGADNPTIITMDANKNFTALFTQIPVAEPSIVQSDDFASCNLNNGLWTLIDPVGDGTVLLSSNRLELAVPAGVRHDIWSGNDSLRIMQAANNTDFEVEVKFESVVQDAYALQGILIEQDNDNFLRFDFYGDGANTNLFAARFTNGSPSAVYNSTIINGITEPLYMRISRTGDQWTQSYSEDGQNWTQGADFAHGLNVGSVGVFAGNTGSRPAHTAVVDYFFNTAAPITPEDGASPQFALTVNPPTNGAVAIDPDQTSYNCGDVVTLTATPDAGWAFNGWSGDFTGNDNPAAVSMDGNKTVTATFVEQQSITYGLNISVTGSGTVVRDPDKAAYGEGEIVTLIASPDSGWAFSSWSGDLVTSNNPAIITMDANKNVTAIYVESNTGDGPTIDVWYGDEQNFGHTGIPQQWVNILGNVSDPDGVQSLSYTLNGEPPRALSVAPYGPHRLERPGDFNADLDIVDLVDGANQVRIFAIDNLGNQTEHTVTVNYQSSNVWPLPYAIDWTTVSNIQDVAQIVDGKWIIGGDGLRPLEIGYDRLVAIGDVAWSDYVVTVPVVVHSVDMASAGGDLPGLGILMRWTGHTDTPFPGKQPKAGWEPYGQIAWWRWSSGSEARLQFASSGAGYQNFTPTVGVTYLFQVRVQTLPGEGSRYYIKVWEEGQPEPVDWNLIRDEDSGNLSNGSLLLLAYYVDASFGNLTVSSALSLNVDTEGLGNVTVDPLKSVYNEGDIVTLTATADEGGTFSGWAGDLTGADNPATITMDGSKSVLATFESPPIVTDPSTIQSDDFALCDLDSGLWTLVDPVGDGAMLLSGGQLELAVPGGLDHDVWTDNNALRIMQAANDTDFEVEVKFESAVQGANALQGILIEQDNDNFLRFDFYSDGVNTKLFAARFTNGAPSIVDNSTIAGSGVAPLYMRVSRTDDQWTQSYSEDGQSWTQGASFAHSLNVGSVGVFAGNGATNPAHTAVVDYFFNTAAPITPEDGTSPQFALTVNPPTNGAVAIDPDQTSYNCGEVVTLTATPDAGWAFDGWSGDFTGNDNPAAITMNGDKTVTATFVEQQSLTYGLTIAVAGNGAVARTPDKAAYDVDEIVTVTASPDPGWTFSGWSGDLTGGNNPTTITMDADKNITANFVESNSGDGPMIDVWYGDEQDFGHLGTPQQWVNILGNVSDPDGVESLSYILNDGSLRALSVAPSGPDRLENPGDFNADLDIDDLVDGANQVRIIAVDTLGNQTERTVTVNFQSSNVWPLPYAVDWATVTNIQDVAQVVDGKWTIGNDGLRPLETGYDRLVAIGDVAWTDYVVTVPMIVHSVDMAAAGGDYPSLGLLVRWTGHTDTPIPDKQPKAGWEPFGQIAWWRWSSSNEAQLQYASSGGGYQSFTPTIGVTYLFQVRVQTLPGEGSRYSIKVWQEGDPEPTDWNLARDEVGDNLGNGSLLLLAYYVDASFGNLTVSPAFTLDVDAGGSEAEVGQDNPIETNQSVFLPYVER